VFYLNLQIRQGEDYTKKDPNQKREKSKSSSFIIKQPSK